MTTTIKAALVKYTAPVAAFALFATLFANAVIHGARKAFTDVLLLTKGDSALRARLSERSSLR